MGARQPGALAQTIHRHAAGDDRAREHPDHPAGTHGGRFDAHQRSRCTRDPMTMDLNRLAFAYGVYLPTLYVRREPVTRYMAELEQSQWMPKSAHEALQERKLRRLLEVARAEVPFYRERIADPG